jgi:hypothetical protein
MMVTPNPGAATSGQIWVLTLLVVASIVGVVLVQGLQTQVLTLPTNEPQECLSLNGSSGSLSLFLLPGSLRSSACLTFQFNGVATFSWTGTGKPISFSVSFGPVVKSGWTGACPLVILLLYTGHGLSGSGAFNETAQPHPITCQGYAMGWSDYQGGNTWNNASLVDVHLAWAPQ